MFPPLQLATQEANGLAERELQDTDRICPPSTVTLCNFPGFL